MYIECRVNLCVATMPSESCPNMCGRSIQPRMLVGNLFTRSYTVYSGPVSLMVTTPLPANANQQTTAEATTAQATATATTVGTAAHGNVDLVYAELVPSCKQMGTMAR